MIRIEIDDPARRPRLEGSSNGKPVLWDVQMATLISEAILGTVVIPLTGVNGRMAECSHLLYSSGSCAC